MPCSCVVLNVSLMIVAKMMPGSSSPASVARVSGKCFIAGAATSDSRYHNSDPDFYSLNNDEHYSGESYHVLCH